MSVIRITKEFKFEMAHALWGYDGPCKNIHGHSYYLYVTISGKPLNDPSSPKNGMVIDYSVIKKIVKENITNSLDHALLLNANTPHKELEKFKNMFDNIVLVPFQPTCENLLSDFASRIQKLLPKEIKLFSLRLSETVTSFAEWYADDNK
ncbi:MAG TPA: 6-carboxytetrahydropterin synthase [Bacteroidales bacterium]|nr:6-carboxytetrahydropterin synthase [Bacteroidales bacterium]HPS15775.1 6-carboxytetrahydropterin synthase [Bacteroidales bacterium]